jgi:hypothetical protein
MVLHTNGKASVLAQKEEYGDAKEYLVKSLKYDENIDKNPDFIFLTGYISYYADDNIENARKLLLKITFMDYNYHDSMDLTLKIICDLYIEKIHEDEIQHLNIDRDFDLNGDSMDSFKNSNIAAFHTIFYKNHDSHLVNMYAYSNPVNNDLPPEIVEMMESGEVELYNDMPEKRDLTTVEDYEEALSDFYDLKGDEYFKEYQGQFWKLYETRPFMMWLLDYSALLWDEEIDKDKSIDLLKYMIKLNSSDNQGVRDILLTRLLELNKLKEFKKYSLEYYKDFGSFALYNNALLAIKNKKTDVEIKSLLKKAIKFNEHVIPFLINEKPIPENLPEAYSLGGLDEAEYYATIAIKA